MKINIPKEILEITRIIEKHHGKCYIVGGFIRDYFLNITSNDFDIEVYNITIDNLIEILSDYGELNVNEKFSTIKYENMEFALPRTEKKCGNMHTEFKITTHSNLNIEQALLRRDFTINTIYYDIENKIVIDKLNAIDDIKNKIIKHVSIQFNEDPLRLLRAIRFSSMLGFKIEKQTLRLCEGMTSDIKYLSRQRIQDEFTQFISGKYISIGIEYLYLLFDYYRCSMDKKLIHLVATTNNITIRLAILFAIVNTDNLEYILNELVTSKIIKKIILDLSTNDFNILENRVEMYYKYDFKSLIIFMCRFTNINVRGEISAFIALKKQYNGNYLKTVVNDNKDIGKTQKEIIIKKLKENENENIFRCR